MSDKETEKEPSKGTEQTDVVEEPAKPVESAKPAKSAKPATPAKVTRQSAATPAKSAKLPEPKVTRSSKKAEEKAPPPEEDSKKSAPADAEPSKDDTAEPPKDPDTVEKIPDDKEKSAISDSSEVAEELKEMMKDIQNSEPSAADAKEPSTGAGKVTTENLISVLEDEPEKGSSEKKRSEASTSDEKGGKPKKYLYKLKSKTGKVLRYTSNVPITLKRPIIQLTKMDEIKSEPPMVVDLEKEDVDSDNSTKENNLKEQQTPSVDNSIRTTKKKGRPPLSAKPVVVSSEDKNDMKNRQTPIFSMQTRKRQLRFLPDGSLVTPEKRAKGEEGKKSKSGSSSSDSEVDVISSEDESKSKKQTPELSKKFKLEKKVVSTGEKRKYKKVFDYESYYREKTGIPPPSNLINASADGDKEKTSPLKKPVDTPRPKLIAPNTSITPKKPTSVDPAQLLSSLIGVTISPNQLNVVKFKPKVVQERANLVATSTPKKVTFEEDRSLKLSTSQTELLKSTPFKVVSKPTFQKILPKPSPSATPIINRTPILPNRFITRPGIPITSTPLVPAGTLTLAHPIDQPLKEVLTKFDNFTDSRVVKTRDGPKKLKRKLDTSDSHKTIYDLMQDIFDTMPSWSLHVIPDTNSFCVGQVARGRMGIPILKKSIEFNSEFSAKVYVHQLHCKRYDGIYDTESKIIKLIREIDALAA